MRFLLFSGHMIDKADRPKQRFPPSKVGAVSAAIHRVVVDALQTAAREEYKRDRSGGLCGGDILFMRLARRWESGTRSTWGYL